MKHYFLIGCLTFLSLFAVAQNDIRFSRLTIDEGLSQNTVFCIIQDQQGFIWIGTADGLNRYDGISFKVYKNDVENENSLPHNLIESLYEDPDGIIWIGTRRGLCSLDKQKDKITRYHNPAIENPASLRIKNIKADKNGLLWLGYEGGKLHTFDKKTKQYDSYGKTINQNNINDILHDSKGRTWIASANGLYLLDKNNKTSQTVSDSLGNIDLIDLCELRNGKILIGSFTGVYIFDGDTKKFTHYSHPLLQREAIEDIYEAPDGTIWVASYGNGIIKISVDGTVSQFAYQASNPKSLSNNDAMCILQDAGGVMWFGTYNGGVNKFDKFANRFKHYFNDPNNPKSLAANSLRGIYEDRDGDVWIATQGSGLSVLNKKTGEFHTFKNDAKNPNSLSEDRLNRVFQDKEGTFWIGTASKGLDKLVWDKNTNKFTFTNYRYKLGDSTSLVGDSKLCAFWEDTNGFLWIGTTTGLSKMDKKTGLFTNFKSLKSNPNSLSNNTIKSIFQDKIGIFWIATEGGGLNRFDETTNTFTAYQHNDKNPKSLSSDLLHAISQDRDDDNLIWIGTAGSGMNLFNKKTGECTRFTEKEGLPNASIYAVLDDGKGNIWGSTNNGLFRFNKKIKQIKTYKASDGLQSNEFNTHSYFLGKSGTMYFGGVNGFNSFSPDDIKENFYVPPVVITDFKLFNKSVTDFDNSPITESIMFVKKMTISYQDYVFSFDFASLHFSEPKKNQYAYKLEGFDKDWNYTDAKRSFVTYTNLPAGDFIFKVKATNSDGVWNKTATEINIKVTPPFWKEWWFSISLVTILLLGAYYWYRLRIKQIEDRKTELENQVLERTSEINLQKEEISSQKEYIEKKNLALEEAYSDVKVLSDIGQKITASLDLENIIKQVYQSVNRLMDASGFGIGVYKEKTYSIDFQGYIEKGETLPFICYDLADKNRIAVICFDLQEEIWMNDIEEEYARYIPQRPSAVEGEEVSSLIYMPLKVEDKIVGLITVQSFQKNAYNPHDLTVLRNLASYIAIAIDNANAYTELNYAKDLIGFQNQNILSSIRYAETIQRAILPKEEQLRAFFSDYFLLYLPKDIVSGDFYWFNRIDEKRAFVAVLDCTGHGVPGALMSIIVFSSLNDALRRFKQTPTPAQVLEALHNRLVEFLRPEDKQNSGDSVDIALCYIERQDNETVKIMFSGAKRPIYVFDSQANQLSVVKGTRKSAGGRHNVKGVMFADTELTAKTNDIIYLTTDGLADQPNAVRERLGTDKVKNKLIDIAPSNLNTQLELLKESLHQHQANEPQRDDITFMALKL